MPITAKIVNNKLVLEVPIDKVPSKTGKSINIATTRGNHKGDNVVS